VNGIAMAIAEHLNFYMPDPRKKSFQINAWMTECGGRLGRSLRKQGSEGLRSIADPHAAPATAA
jgi:hypothetical protein